MDLAPAPVHVQHIAQRLKGEEGDTDGQLDPRHRKMPAQPVEGVQHEGQVLEDKQKPQIGRRGRQEREAAGGPRPAAPVHPKPEPVVGQDGGDHDQHEPGLPPGVKQQGGRQQEHVLPLPPAAQGQIVHQQHQGQEQEEKQGAGKEHGFGSFM